MTGSGWLSSFAPQRLDPVIFAEDDRSDCPQTLPTQTTIPLLLKEISCIVIGVLKRSPPSAIEALAGQAREPPFWNAACVWLCQAIFRSPELAPRWRHEQIEALPVRELLLFLSRFRLPNCNIGECHGLPLIPPGLRIVPPTSPGSPQSYPRLRAARYGRGRTHAACYRSNMADFWGLSRRIRTSMNWKMERVAGIEPA